VSLASRRRTDAERRPSSLVHAHIAGIAHIAGVHHLSLRRASASSAQRPPSCSPAVPRRRPSLSASFPAGAPLSLVPAGSQVLHSRPHRPRRRPSLRSRARALPSQRSSSCPLTVLVPPANTDSHHCLVCTTHRHAPATPARRHCPHSSLLLRSTRSRRRPPSALALLSPLAYHSSTHPLSPPLHHSPTHNADPLGPHTFRIAPTARHSHRHLCATSSCPGLAPPPVCSPCRHASHRRRTDTPNARTTRHALPTRRRTTHISVLHTTLHYRTTHSHAPRIIVCRRRPELLCHPTPPAACPHPATQRPVTGLL